MLTRKIVLTTALAIGLLLTIGFLTATTLMPRTNQPIMEWLKAHEGEPASVKDFTILSTERADEDFYSTVYEPGQPGYDALPPGPFDKGILPRRYGPNRLVRKGDPTALRVKASWRAKTPFGGWTVRNMTFVLKDGKVERAF